MSKLLSALGLMRVSEHERIVSFLSREDWKGVALDFEAKFKLAATDLAAQAEEITELCDAGDDVINQATDYYTARNNRRISIEGDDGEKCWIVPFDPFEHLRAYLKRSRDRRAGKAVKS